MNAKNIKRCLIKKIKAWLGSIKDKQLRIEVEPHIIITGGSIVDMLIGEPPKDYDIYFDDKETTKKVAQYYINQFNKNRSKTAKAELKEENERISIFIKSRGVAAENKEVLESPFEDAVEVLDEADQINAKDLEITGRKEKYRPVFLSSNAITLSDKIQIIVRFYGEPDEIHKNYDFVHCTNYFYFKDLKLTLRPDAMEAILAKELRYTGSKYPLCSVIRTRKFIKRGWIINAGQYLKMLFQVSKLDLTDIKTLEDQLVGVDSAYFQMLVVALKAKQKNDKEFQISYPYVMSIIDKIF